MVKGQIFKGYRAVSERSVIRREWRVKMVVEWLTQQSEKPEVDKLSTSVQGATVAYRDAKRSSEEICQSLLCKR
ncbi:hypothetical protein VIBRN418_13831 [Vibrio sp. N418]|nr:hypothetical protein VIBRN418_13831 [Vibrio sp. N418]